MMLKHFKNHAEARAEHERFGGVLLIEGNNLALCHSCFIGRCRCRDSDYVQSLAPSWDESHPDNVGRRITDKDQGELF
jgi:hypothetical protein